MGRGNHDMSDSACIERAEHHKEHDRLKQQEDNLANVLTNMLKAIQANRASIEVHTEMLKMLKKETEDVRSSVANSNRNHLDT